MTPRPNCAYTWLANNDATVPGARSAARATATSRACRPAPTGGRTPQDWRSPSSAATRHATHPRQTAQPCASEPHEPGHSTGSRCLASRSSQFSICHSTTCSAAGSPPSAPARVGYLVRGPHGKHRNGRQHTPGTDPQHGDRSPLAEPAAASPPLPSARPGRIFKHPRVLPVVRTGPPARTPDSRARSDRRTVARSR